MLFGIEGCGIVLKVLDERSRLRAFIEDLGLAFVNATAAIHGDQPWLEGIDWRQRPLVKP
jgi:hypothetical protein